MRTEGDEDGARRQAALDKMRQRSERIEKRLDLA